MSAEHKTSIHDRMGGGLMDGAWRPGVAWRLEQRRRERFRIRMRGRKRGRWFIPRLVGFWDRKWAKEMKHGKR